MTHEEAQKLWRDAEILWKPSKPGEAWFVGWQQCFGGMHRLPHDDQYDDGEGGLLRIGEQPSQPGVGSVLVRVYPSDRAEIRILKK